MNYQGFFNIDKKGWKLYHQIDCDYSKDFQVLQLEPFILSSKSDSALNCNAHTRIIIGQIGGILSQKQGNLSQSVRMHKYPV